MNKLQPGQTASFNLGHLVVRVDRHHDGIAFTVDHHNSLNQAFTDRDQAATYFRYLRDNGHRPAWQLEAEVGVLLSAAAILTEAAANMTEVDEVIHLRRGWPSPIACGATGPVRVTQVFSEVTCQPCIDAEDQRLGRANDSDQPATLDAYTRPGPRDFTRSRVHRQDPTPAELHAILHAVDNGDGTFTVRTRPGQTWLVLRGLYRRIGGERTYRKGTKSVIASLTYTAGQLADYLPIGVAA